MSQIVEPLTFVGYFLMWDFSKLLFNLGKTRVDLHVNKTQSNTSSLMKGNDSIDHGNIYKKRFAPAAFKNLMWNFLPAEI